MLAGEIQKGRAGLYSLPSPLQAAPVMGTEDVTYANLKFEKRTAPTACNVVYTEMKPPQQKQGGGDAGAADAGVDASPQGEG